MSQLLLVGNPAKRRTTKRRKAPSAAQKAARAKFAAASRARSRKSRSRSLVAVSNPAPRRRRRAAKRTIRRARRNPIGGMSGLNMRSIIAQLKDAGIGAAGAIGVDVVYGYASGYLPDAIKTPTNATGGINYAYYAAKGATAIAASMLLKKVIGANKANAVSAGSLVVTAHDLLKAVMGTSLPSVQMGYMPGGLQLPGRALGLQVSRARDNVSALPNRSLAGVGAYISASEREVVRR